MKELIPLHDLARERNLDLTGNDVYDPTGRTAYGSDGERIGTVRSALADPDTGRLRYLLIDAGGWFSSKEVLVPVGLARTEEDGVYFDTLTRDQVRDLHGYQGSYDYDSAVSDERVLRGSDDVSTATTTAPVTAERTYNYRDDDETDRLFKSPGRLQLLEERLNVGKDRYVAGSVEIGKHVENRQQNVNVELQHEEVVIERHAVDPRPVEGNVTLGAASETVRVDLEAERADVRKQAYVAEEVEIGKRTETEHRTVTETVGREVLDVNRTGDVDVAGTGANREGLLERADEAVDRLDGKIDRDHNR
ncbi:PRC and DUF2382 domain-containing protein [Deinococcus pimensis]|uniref:PRC and DUF2382 domain-containing protein n=1 Tax=Deinococcus pimensis TaxID=309888 RepID=UPI0004AEFD24|nr:DUF2382 domain-containing protein [Deinococcus pimensis]